MRKLLSVLVRVVMILAMCLGITLLIAALISLWEGRFRSNTPSSTPIPPAANIAAPAEGSKLELAHDQLIDELDWTRAEIHELRKTLNNPAMQSLMAMFRDRDCNTVNFNEIMAATGRNMSQVRADLSMLSRKSHLIDQHSDWPLDTAVPTDGESNRAYSIHPQYIAWWFEH